MKKFKVSYSYPLEHPIKVVIERTGLLGLTGWLMQKYGGRATKEDLVISERVIELPLLHQWIGRIFEARFGQVLEIGHVASSTSLELASLGFEVTAIDLRPYPFNHKNLTSIQGDFLKHTFNKQFDCIFSLSTIEHFGFSERYGGEDQEGNTLDEEAFHKISNLLVPEGKAIVSFPYAQSHVPGVWFRVYTRRELEEKLGKNFEIVEARYYRRDTNEWTRVTGEENDPASPHDGVALFLLNKSHGT
jgi:hypothetical protein